MLIFYNSTQHSGDVSPEISGFPCIGYFGLSSLQM